MGQNPTGETSLRIVVESLVARALETGEGYHALNPSFS